MIYFKFRKESLTFCEKINLLILILLFIFSLFNLNNPIKKDLFYSTGSFFAAYLISTTIFRITPIIFDSMAKNILQIHIFISIFLGSALNFYSILPNFDFWLHMSFGITSSILCIPIVNHFCKISKINLPQLNIFFIIFIIFCFSSTTGVLWEIYEFSIDALFNLNTQNNSLLDTMSDLIAHTIGLCAFLIFYYSYLKNKKRED